MSDSRLFLWLLVMLGFIILFPVVRKIINSKNSYFTEKIFKNILLTVISSGLVLFLHSQDYLKSPEFQFLIILVVFIFLSSGFNSTVYSWKSEKMKLVTFNKSVLQKISKSFSGSKIDDIDVGYNFIIRTPYRLGYQIGTITNKEEKFGVFEMTSLNSNQNLIKLLNLSSIYLILQAFTSDDENVNFPFFGFETSAVLAVLFAITISLIILYIEIESANSILQSLPQIYTKILQNEALNKLSGGLKKPELDVKVRAQSILDKRKSNVLQAKREEVHGKLKSVFGEKETAGLDKKSIERMRLMETVKRILNSTPPWSEVSLSDISKLAKGAEEEVEIVIAGLRNLKDVGGIYDIWTKTYYGTSSSHWLITKLLNDMPSTSTALENVRIYPDGGGEFSFKKKDEDKST